MHLRWCGAFPDLEVAAIVRVSLVWIALLAGVMLWTVIAHRWFSLSDAWSIYVPAMLAFVALVLAAYQSQVGIGSRSVRALAAVGIAIVLTAILLWLWFIVSWGLLGGSGP